MASIISLLSGGAGPWILIGGLLLSAAGGGFAGYEARGIKDAPAIADLHTEVALADGRTADCKATAEKGRADGNQKTVDALQGGIAALNGVVADLSSKEGARQAADQKFEKELANAPKSAACGASAAERAYRDSVQH